MYKDDDLLEERLHQMEAQPGSAPGGEGDSKEMTSLVNLAASIRGMEHPEQSLQTTRAEKRRLMAAAQDRKRSRSRLGWSPNGGFTGQWLAVPALAGAALLILMAFVLATGAGIYFSGPRGAHEAVLSSGSGVIEVLDQGGTGGWYTVSDGDRVSTGQRLHTGQDSQVTLTFFEGTQVSLEPNTDLMLDKVDGDWGKELQVVLIQNDGMTSHEVIPLQGNAATYNVMTPSGEASVRGTAFNVLVEETGDAVFSVDHGAVLVSNDGEEALVAAGQGLVTELGKPLAATSYLFLLNGELTDNTGKTWAVEGFSFTVRGNTSIDPTIDLGSPVLVSGRITNKNEWIADSIVYHEAETPGGSFTGIVTGEAEGQIEISGEWLNLPEGAPEFNLGDLVRVTFTILDDSWNVDTLEVLESSAPSEPDSEPEDETEPPEEPEADVFFATNEEEKTTTCGQVEPFVYDNMVYYISADEQATELEVHLQGTVEAGGEFVGVLIEPETFTVPPNLPTADPLTGVPFTVTVQLNTDTLPPETEIEIKIELIEVSSGEPTGDVYKIKLECDQELPDEEDTDTDDDGDKCTRDGEHPHARTLAVEYGYLLTQDVGNEYERIWRWFCEDNLGFGEIELGFKLTITYGEATGYDVYDIIDMRLVGDQGWGQIKNFLKKEAANSLLLGEESQGKVPPGKEKSEEAKNKPKPNKKDE